MSDARIAIVTGGASGIGFEFSQGLAKAGYGVMIADLRNAEAAAERLCAEGMRVGGVTTDVTSEEETAAMVDATLRQFGRLDVLVNNAGLFTTIKPKPFDQISAEEWMTVMKVNTLGPFHCSKSALSAMEKQNGGRIINIASVAPIKGTPLMLHYVASKGAVIAFTRSLSRELGPKKITVNAIAPGFTISDGVLESGLHNVLGEGARKAGRSIVRDQLPRDLLSALLFLADEGSDFITGQTIAIDGGSVFL